MKNNSTDVESKENTSIAEHLREAASLLEMQGANRYRVAAYRNAARTVEDLPQDVSLIFQSEGFQGLTALPGIGSQIGGAIVEMIRTGQWSQLERLRGTLDPESLFSRVPGIGPTLARRVVNELHMDTLEGLEIAVHDGRLDNLPGFGARRIAMTRAALAEMLGRGRRSQGDRVEPPVDMLLDVDREYRRKAEANKLPTIATMRFNPEHKAWLPILHTERGPWRFTALYSNTALAHKLSRTRNWVVIYFQTDSQSEGQRTVVTETQGPMRGNRIVRGRESECQKRYSLFWPEPTNAA
jgi:putative hydrolase